MLNQVLAHGIPLLLICLAALIADLAGLINLALEGVVLLGTLLGVIALDPTVGPYMVGLVALGGGGVFGLVFGLAHSRLGANQYLAGLGVHLLAVATTTILGQAWFGTLHSVPAAASSNSFGFAPVIVVVGVFGLFWLFYYYSLMGIRLRSLSEHSKMLYARGVHVRRYQIGALIISAGLACLGGAFLGYGACTWSPETSQGLGWMAIVLVYVGGRRPLGLLVAVLVFEIAQQLGTVWQKASPSSLMAMAFPALVITVGLVLTQLGQVWRRRVP